MTLLKHAVELAEKGFHVFPLVPNSKEPLIPDYPNAATQDQNILTDWWTKWPNANIGISTTRYNGTGAIVAVDVDNKDGRSGSDTLLSLELKGFRAPKTFTQVTPTGGEHLLYFSEVPLKQGTAVLGEGLDIRSRGGYLVASGSVINGKKYYIKHELPLAQVPAWVAEKCGLSKPKKERGVSVEGINQKVALDRAMEYLEQFAPSGQSGNRNQTGYRVANRLKDLGLDRDVTEQLMSDFWDCDPALEREELSAVVDSAYKYGENEVGHDSPEAAFEQVIGPETKSYLEKMNEEFALVFEGGGHSILHEVKNQDGKKDFTLMNELSFKRLFSTSSVALSSPHGRSKSISYANIWLDWPGRRQYKGLLFSPGKESPGYYNTWQGFTVSPLTYEEGTAEQKTGFDSFISHAKENICKGDESLFNYLIGYFAHMIQFPREKPLTTLVFQGSKGTGKNALIDRVGRLLGNRHYLVAHDDRYLTSNFNGHFESCLCLVLDEAFWSGDKSAEGKLKGITTSPTLLIERKGKEPYSAPNLVRLIVIGNEEWLVPSSEDERRYAVYKVGEGKKNNFKFFSDMRRNLDELGGNRILLDYLQKFDLSKINLSQIPHSEGLLEQKLKSQDPLGQWWHECLSSGRLVEADMADEWEREVDKTRFRQAFKRYVSERQIRGRLPHDRVIGKILKGYSPSFLTDCHRRDGGAFVKTYRLPDLEVARTDWEKYLGHQIDWSKQ